MTEVESGHCTPGNLGRALGPERTRKGIVRMGLMERPEIMDMLEQELTSIPYGEKTK